MTIIKDILTKSSQKDKKKVAIIGTNGIPAKYGGFETLAENLVNQLNTEFHFIVYCSNIYKKNDRAYTFENTQLVYLPFKANGIQSLFYDFFSFIHALIFAKTILFLGPTSSGIITFLNRIVNRNLLVNHGGLNEWEREKYTQNEKRWAKFNHKIASKNATVNITDNTLLKKSISEAFKADSIVIRYGGDHSKEFKLSNEAQSNYNFLNSKFYLSVARAQVDNNIHLLIDAFKNINTHPLVIISNWDISEYGKNILEKNKDQPNIILLNAIYDINILNAIRSSCYVYIHSHSFCGTAPSLVEVMNLNVPIICFDVPTNRETTENQSFYFDSVETLQKTIKTIDSNDLFNCKKSMFEIAKKEYRWNKISKQYSNIF